MLCLEGVNEGVQVIEHYIGSVLSHACKDDSLTQSQRQISPRFQWDLKALSRKALELYCDGKQSMTIEDIRECSAGQSEDGEIDDAAAWAAVHKCPLLVREDQVIFMKMLRPAKINIRDQEDKLIPTWDLMMKNIYDIGAFQLSRED